MRSILVALALLALVPAIAAAQGQTCVILPAPDGTTVPADAWGRVEATFTTALRAQGFVVISSRDAQLRLAEQPTEHCSAIECAPEVNRFLGTSVAVILEPTWLRGRMTMINVVLIGLDASSSVGGQAIVDRTDVDAAVNAAFATAWDRWRAESQGTLVIDSTPVGAFVEIDGQAIGRAPIRQLVTAGLHTLRTSLDGHTTDTREITVDRHEERTVLVDLPEAGAADVAPPVVTYTDEPHWGNWLIGGLGIAAAIGLAVVPIETAATLGNVAVHAAGMGTDTVYFGDVSIALTVTSAVVLVGSIVWLVLHPWTERVASPGSVTAHLDRLEIRW